MITCITCGESFRRIDIMTGEWLSGPYVCTECASRLREV